MPLCISITDLILPFSQQEVIFLYIQIQIQIVYSVQNIIHKTVDSSISKIYYIQYSMFNNNEHSILHMISETLISSVIQLKLDILLMKLQNHKVRNSSTE